MAGHQHGVCANIATAHPQKEDFIMAEIEKICKGARHDY